MGNYQALQLNYLRHPAYRNYPVVGVDWMQANSFCAWRTDRVNERILIREGILITNPMQQDEPFTTEAYLAGQYDLGISPMGQLPNKDPSKGGYNPITGKFKSSYQATRNVKIEDGILLPRYRLPTEAEWEFAASAGTNMNSKESKRWAREYRRSKQAFGFNKNWQDNNEEFVNEYGLVSPVNNYLPNDIGLFHINSNVSEWVADVYQPRTGESVQLISPLASNDQVIVSSREPEGRRLNKYDEVIYDVYEMNKYMIEFRKVVSRKLEFDTVQQFLLENIEYLIAEAICEYELSDFPEGSRRVRRIFDELIMDNAYYYESLTKKEVVLHEEIYDELRRGLSQFVLYHPGQIGVREQTPEESIRRRNVNNTNLWESNYDETLDSLSVKNQQRVFKGGSFINTDTLTPLDARKGLDRYDQKCYIGFRCAMDRLGSPVGLGK